jgi:beta-lactamase class A
MPHFLNSFLFKLILTVIISVFIGTQLAKIEFKEYNHSFRKILGVQAVKGDEELEGRIAQFLQNQEGDYAVYVKDLTPEGKRNVYINSDQVYEAASLYKLFLMAAVFEKISKGEMTLETEISAKIGHLDDILGAREYGYEDYESEDSIGHTVKESLERVAMFSDNYAAIMLAEKVGWPAVQDAADHIGALNTKIKTPISTSAEDVGLLLEKVYNGQIVSFESSEEIINMLTKAQINNRIPAKLPKELKIAHKTGELSQVRNDAGIVFLEGNPYVIVMMTKNLKYEDEGIENLAEVSKIVYDYYSSKSE